MKTKTLLTGMLLVIVFALGCGKSKDEAKFIIDGTYHVSVNRSINDAVKTGNYDWADSSINDQRFMADQPHEIDIIVGHFTLTMETDSVLKALDEVGLRPATMSELLALGIWCPELQRQFPIVELGSVWQISDGDHVFGCIEPSTFGNRFLLLRYCISGWIDRFRFAAVRK